MFWLCTARQSRGRGTDQRAGQGSVWAVAQLLSRQPEVGAQGAHRRAAQASLRRGPNAPGAGIGQRRGEAANQAAIGTGEGTLESLCAQASGGPQLEGDRFAT